MERIEGGCRTRGIPVPNSDGPILSVVTIVYNRLEDLKITLPNVLAQSYESIEYIIVDGASTDGCREYIQEHDERIAYWVSEPDKGLYDAMNKGLSLAKGDYVWFMNSGDEIFESDTCQKMVDGLIGDPDVIFGETMMIDESRKEVGLRSEITTQRLPEELALEEPGAWNGCLPPEHFGPYFPSRAIHFESSLFCRHRLGDQSAQKRARAIIIRIKS